MMTPLEKLFEETVPQLLKKGASSQSKGIIGFAATGAVETGFWIVSLADKAGRRGTHSDAPDVVVEADATAFALLFSGGLDVARALDAGVLTVRGDRAKLVELAKSIGL